MSIENIRATVCCDGCGRTFRVELDPAAGGIGRVGKWALFDIAEDSIRGGNVFVEYVPENNRQRQPGRPIFTSVVENYHLCPGCTLYLDGDKARTLASLQDRYDE